MSYHAMGYCYMKRCVAFCFTLLLAHLALGQEKKVLRKADFSDEINDFKRSSLKLLMVETPKKERLQTIKTTFEDISIPKKFNDHGIGALQFVPLKSESKDHSTAIGQFLKEQQVARKMVANWFNRTKNGSFDIELLKTRGLYNASAFDIQIAKQTLRGNALLEDAGEELIANSFIIVNDYKYTNKEEVLSKGKTLLNDFNSLIGTKKTRDIQTSTTADAAEVLAKGYVIKTTSYLYRLVWDEATANTFFGKLWVTKDNYDKSRVAAFNDTEIFKLKYIGRQDAWADVQSTKYTSKTEDELIARATIKATDAAIARLERKFEVFRTKTPLVSIDPIAAKIGTKEGVQKGDRYEVLEQLLMEDGTITYKKVTEITVNPNQIWDNSYLPEEIPDAAIEHTTFKGSSKKLYPGMLIRFKRNQNPFK